MRITTNLAGKISCLLKRMEEDAQAEKANTWKYRVILT